MLSNLLKIILFGVVVAACFYCAFEFGANSALIWVAVAAGVMPLSVFRQSMKSLARTVGIGFFVLSSLSLGLLMLAASVGGSFHMSSSNKVIALLLLVIVLISGSSFAWPRDHADKPE